MRTGGRDLLTHSRMATFKTCPRKHYFKYDLGIVRDRDSAPLRFGGNFHLGLELLGKGESLTDVCQTIRQQYADPPAWAQDGDELEAWRVEEEQVVRMLCGYEWMWGTDGITVVATEQQFCLPIRNPVTGGSSTRYRIGGKMDQIVRLPGGQLAVMEHKTTGDPIESPDADFWKRTRLDHQVSLYFWAAWELGYGVETIVYDVIHKPGIKPKKLTKSERKQYVIGPDEDEAPERETIRMYGDRLTEDIGTRPHYYFRREEVPRLMSDIGEFRAELWQQQKAIAAAHLHGRHYRNTGACSMPYRCEYLDICHGCGSFEDGIPDGYKKLDYVHPELEEMNGTLTTTAAEGTTETTT